ncbi:MAG: ATP-binding protein [Planctomycetaceae bacterium]|nr:ATP-binding protein [Planctomycetaceae bacterium]
MLLEQLEVLRNSGLLTNNALLELQGTLPAESRAFKPRAPESLRQAGVSDHLAESLVLKLLLTRGTTTGREISTELGLPFRVLEEFLRQLKKEQLVAHRSSAGMQDYVYELTATGHERALRCRELSAYVGVTPVPHTEWVASVEQQSLRKEAPGPDDLRRAVSDLVLPDKFFRQVGQAVASGKGLFLYGLPGNGKTSIAQRICGAFGKHIWIPRALLYDNEVVRLYDPIVHVAAETSDDPGIDARWIKIVRPTVIVGGELTLDQLEMAVVGSSNVVEAPLQMKSNCGLLVIDDFGRQRCSPRELLNRWIVPLETGVDYLNLPSGKKVCVPFEQMIVFSTNLAPKELVDEAFLRRIPYKIEAPNPSDAEFRRVFGIVAEKLEIQFDQAAYDYMVQKHFREAGREFRYCHPRDLLQQIKTFCKFEGLPLQMTHETIDAAAENYFVNLDV